MEAAQIRGIHAGHGLFLFVPGLVALLHLVECVGRFFPRGVGAEEVLAWARGVSGLNPHVPCAEPPLLVGVRHAY